MSKMTGYPKTALPTIIAVCAVVCAIAALPGTATAYEIRVKETRRPQSAKMRVTIVRRFLRRTALKALIEDTALSGEQVFCGRPSKQSRVLGMRGMLRAFGDEVIRAAADQAHRIDDDSISSQPALRFLADEQSIARLKLVSSEGMFNVHAPSSGIKTRPTKRLDFRREDGGFSTVKYVEPLARDNLDLRVEAQIGTKTATTARIEQVYRHEHSGSGLLTSTDSGLLRSAGEIYDISEEGSAVHRRAVTRAALEGPGWLLAFQAK